MSRFQPFRLERLLIFVQLACILLSAAPARAGGIAPDLASQLAGPPAPPPTLRLIVQFNQAGVNSGVLAAAYGGIALFDLPFIQGAVLEMPPASIPVLADDPLVSRVSPDRLIFRHSDYDVQTVGADRVWTSRGVRGRGVGVAVLDSGVYAGSADWNTRGGFRSRIAGWLDLVNGQPLPYDDNGHGTHVAGAALGSGNHSNGFITGTAPEASLVAVKVLGADGSGFTSIVILGIAWCVENRAAFNLRVLNLSLGQRPGESHRTDPLCTAVRRAVREGVMVVCSAGNKGKDSAGKTVYGGTSCPGNEPAALTVGALNTFQNPDRRDDGVTSYSSRGPTHRDHLAKPDLVAPGNRILSVRAPGSRLDVSFPENRAAYGKQPPGSEQYFRLSGSSMAAPQVSGTAALMLEANPGLTPNLVKAILMYTAQELDLRDEKRRKLSRGLSILTQGAGSLNAVGAVDVARKIDTTRAVGTWWLTSRLRRHSFIGYRMWRWRAEVLWGDSIYSGAGLIGYRQAAWGDQITWGDQTTWGDRTTWGDNGVAGDQITWGETSIWGDQITWGDQFTWGDSAILAGGD